MGYLGVMSSKDWIVNISGMPVKGLAEDSNITLSLTDDHVTPASGIGGDWTFVINPTKQNTLTFTTFRNSPSNSVLHGLQQSDTVFPVTLTNTRNLSTHLIGYAMFQKQPDDGANNGTDAQTLEWVVVSGDSDSVIL